MVQDASQLLDEAAELIAKASADTAGQAAQRASQATTLSLIVMLAVCAASVVGRCCSAGRWYDPSGRLCRCHRPWPKAI